MLRCVLALCSALFVLADRDALPIAAFKPYPGYKGMLNSSGFVMLAFDTQQPQVLIMYNLNHVDSRCVTPNPNVNNSCGLHVHVGFSCAADSLVGGHYFNSRTVPKDPWTVVSYMANPESPETAMGETSVEFGYPLDNTKGRAFVLHDYTGARVACALLPATTDQVHLGHIGVYPAYLGNINSITGTLSLDFRATSVQLSWALNGVDSACTAKSDMENSCGIHIHEGTSCDTATAVGGHYYDKSLFEKDVWQNVFYTSNSEGATSGSMNVEFGYGFEQAKGRTVVIHDQSGNRVSCTVLPMHASRETVAVTIQPFPEMTRNITGRVMAEFRGEGVKLSYKLMGATNCGTPGTAPNSCGIHIHTGFTCDLTTVMGHYFNPSTFPADPWAYATYLTSGTDPTSGSVMVSYGRDWDHSKGRVVVVHDAEGAKVACGVLPATTDRVHTGPFSALISDARVEGSVTLDFRASSVHLAYSLLNVDPQCSERGTAANSCGIHIHEGTSCASGDSAGKHFFNTPEDPWANVYYKSNGTASAGAVNVENGYGFAETAGRVVVVHNYEGTKVACAVIQSTKLRDVAGLAQLEPTVESTAKGTVLLDSRGMGTKITYTLTGVEAACSTPGSAPLSCGLHIHRNFTCQNMEVGTHYFNASLYPEDPWMHAVYSSQGTNASGSIVVSYGEDFAHSAGRAFVIHDYAGLKVSCATIPQTTDRVTVEPLVKFEDKQALQGSVTLDFRASSVHIAYDLKGVDPLCVHPSNATNSCGLHIHTGTVCNLSEVNGHFYDLATVAMDPWAPDHIFANAEGEAKGSMDVEFGFGYAQSKGRALVLHDQSGAKVACALIPAIATESTVAVGDFAAMTGYDGLYKSAEASVSASFKADSVTLAYSLANVPCECSAPGPKSNSCGLHIHEGACSDVGKHYYDGSKMTTDPWAVAVYSAVPCMASSETSGTSAQGSLTVQYGYGYEAAKDKVMVVHDYNGVKIACAPISPTHSPVLMIVLIASGAVLLLGVGLLVFLRRRKKADPNGILHQNLLANTDRTNAMRRTLSVNV